jgi:pimeloyl-ACP methyl ester carboxylesterase
VPADVVEAHIELTERLDRAAADDAYLRSARSLSLVVARPAETLERLGRIRQPTLLLHGEKDVLVPLSSAQRMQASHPDWRLEVAPDIGHVPMLEAPSWTVAQVTRWLGAEGAAAAAGSAAGHPVQAEAIPLPPAPTPSR